MKNTSLLLLTLSFLLVCCKPNKSNESESSIESSFVVDNRLLEIINLIRDDIEADSVFFLVSIYNQNDSDFLLITEDIRPPLIFDYKPYKGYYRHENDYVFFFSTLNDSLSSKFFNKNKLRNTLDDLRTISFNAPSPIYDGELYIYYIDKSYNLELIK